MKIEGRCGPKGSAIYAYTYNKFSPSPSGRQNLAEFCKNWQNLSEFGRFRKNLAYISRFWQIFTDFGGIWQKRGGCTEKKKKEEKNPLMCVIIGRRPLWGRCPKSRLKMIQTLIFTNISKYSQNNLLF